MPKKLLLLLLLLLAVPPATLQDHPLARLASSHPVAFTGLIDSCVRCQLLEPEDALLPAVMLSYTALEVAADDGRVDATALLGDPAAVSALVSALASLVKRVGVLTKAAGHAHAQPLAATNSPQLTAAACVPAAVPPLISWALRPIAVGVSKVVAQLQQSTQQAVNTSSSSSSGSSSAGGLQLQRQCRASAVLLARPLVVLTDAMEAAAAAAGTTSQQLFAR
jgi:hypothetical protein